MKLFEVDVFVLTSFLNLYYSRVWEIGKFKILSRNICGLTESKLNKKTLLIRYLEPLQFAQHHPDYAKA